MNCYICDQQPCASGTHFHVRPAVGICHHCGIGVCAEHSHKSTDPGAPLLCRQCADLAAHPHHDYATRKEFSDLQPA
jgi:hypothetical protein